LNFHLPTVFPFLVLDQFHSQISRLENNRAPIEACQYPGPLRLFWLFNSIMWSNIFTLSIRGLASDTSQGS